MALPALYRFLLDEPGPALLREALTLYGVREAAGERDNPTILAWARECGLKTYRHDQTAWCGLFMAVACRRAGWNAQIPATPLWALAWAQFGQPSPEPALGDILVFVRPGGGHVGLYVGQDATHFHVLGGNQSDSVSITRIARSRLRAARRPIWRVRQPPNIRPIRLEAEGAPSRNEA